MTGEYRPRFTILLDLPVEQGLKRARGRNRKSPKSRKEGRFEAERLAFHRRVREGYLRMARRERQRYIVVPAQGDRRQLHEEIWSELAPRLDR